MWNYDKIPMRPYACQRNCANIFVENLYCAIVPSIGNVPFAVSLNVFNDLFDVGSVPNFSNVGSPFGDFYFATTVFAIDYNVS